MCNAHSLLTSNRNTLLILTNPFENFEYGNIKKMKMEPLVQLLCSNFEQIHYVLCMSVVSNSRLKSFLRSPRLCGEFSKLSTWVNVQLSRELTAKTTLIVISSTYLEWENRPANVNWIDRNFLRLCFVKKWSFLRCAATQKIVFRLFAL